MAIPWNMRQIAENTLHPPVPISSSGRCRKAEIAEQHGLRLMAAVIDDNEDRIRTLIKEGENPNIISTDPLLEGRTTLSYAISSNNPEIVEILLNAGADPNLPGRNGNVALNSAIGFNNIYNEQINLRKYLLRYEDTDPEHTISLENRRDKNLEIIRLLIDAGANPYIKGGWQVTPFQAATNETKLFIKLILNKKTLRELRFDNSTYLSIIPRDLVGIIENELSY